MRCTLRPRCLAGAALLLVALFMAGGCVYLRLLQVKAQLSQFNRYFLVHAAPEATIVFLEPVLLVDDAPKILRLEPSERRESESEIALLYHFQKRRDDAVAENGAHDMLLTLRFVEGKLRDLGLPLAFAEFLTPEALAKLFSRLQEAQLDTEGHRAAWLAPELAEQLSRHEDILRFLGAPTTSEREDEALVLTYDYDVLPAPGREVQRDAARFRITMNPVKDYLTRSEISMGRISFDVRFDPPAP